MKDSKQHYRQLSSARPPVDFSNGDFFVSRLIYQFSPPLSHVHDSVSLSFPLINTELSTTKPMMYKNGRKKKLLDEIQIKIFHQ